MFRILCLIISLDCVEAVIAQSDSEYFDELKSKAETFYFTNPDSTNIYSDSLFALASAKGDIVYMGEARRLKGVFYQLRADSDSAKSLFEEAASLFETARDSTRFGRALLSIALMDISLGNYTEALDLLFQAKAISETQGVEQYTLRAIAEMGRVYSIQGDHDKALPQFQYYYKKVKHSENLQQLATALNYLSVEFMQIHDNDSSFFYLYKNLEIQKKLRYPIGIAAALQNIGSVFLEINNPEKALIHYKEANQYYADANFSQGIGQVKLNMASIYIGQRKFKNAVKSLEEAIYSSSAINDYHAMKAQFELLSTVYDSIGDDGLSLENYRRFHAMSDTLLNIDKQRTISELFTKYETKEKEQKIELQQSQLGQKDAKLERNQILIITLGVMAVLLVVIVLLVRSKARKKQTLIIKDAQLQLRTAEITAVIHSQEKERNRFARDLHDGFGQLISVLKLNLSELSAVSKEDTEKRLEVYQNGESVINDMFAELRNICFDLMPQTLVKSGLAPALKELGLRINQTNKVYCDVLTFDAKDRLIELTEISMFRISQEWVNNVLKYASADHITVQLTQDLSEVTLTIEDNGKGFDVNTFYDGTGNGWKNIQTRLKQMNANFDLDTREGKQGTMMTVNVKLEKRNSIPNNTEIEITAW